MDEDKRYISKIDIYTPVNVFVNNILTNNGYSFNVDTKQVNNQNVLYTGGKTRILKDGKPYVEYTNIVTGDTNGDGKITYLDYVKIYNHIQKEKHPESDKNQLENEYLIAGDLNEDNKITYLDYVKIYNTIKEFKGGTN